MKDILLALALLGILAIALALDDSFKCRQPDPQFVPPYINYPQGNE